MVGIRRLYLQPDAAYAAAQQLGSSSGEGIGVASQTLYRRMHQRGLLLSTERRGGSTHLKVRKSIGKKRQMVLHIRHDLMTAHTSQSSPTGPTEPSEENAQ
jgi:hypothetical protein